MEDRRSGRRRPRTPGRFAPERLEGRELLAYSPLGYSLPDLTISGFAAPVAAYGGPLGVTVDIQNLGASSTIEPLALAPGAVSTADSGPVQVDVLLSRTRRFGPNAIVIGTIDVPSVPQNSLTEVTSIVTMPSQIRNLPGSGGTVYAYFRVHSNPAGAQEVDVTNNVTRVGSPILIAAPLPELEAIALDTPPVAYGGDAIRPTVKVANYGTVPTAPQGPVTVALVASTDQNFGPGDLILSTFTVDNIQPLSVVPQQNRHTLLGDINLVDPANVVTLTTPTAITLPDSTIPYYFGVIVDPFNTIREISEVGQPPDTSLSPVVTVEPTKNAVPPSTVFSDSSSAADQFPTPPFGRLDVPGNRSTDTTTTTTTSFAVTQAAAAGSFSQSLVALYNGGGKLSGKSRTGASTHRTVRTSLTNLRRNLGIRPHQADAGSSQSIYS